MRSLKILLILTLVLCSSATPDPGDLIDYDYQEMIPISTIESALSIIGLEGLLPPIYSITSYDIQYESQGHENTIDTLTGLVAIHPFESVMLIFTSPAHKAVESNIPQFLV